MYGRVERHAEKRVIWRNKMDMEDIILRGIISIVVFLVAFFVAALISTPFIGVNFNPGTGEKVGQIVRMTNEGIVCKTWEAQLIRGGLNNGSGAFGVTPFEFTIIDPLMAEKVQDYMDSQQEVKITYITSGFYKTCSSGSGGDFLVSIEPRVK